MATGKDSFILYTKYVHVARKLSDEMAGKLYKMILEYVNDTDPQTDDLVLDLLFEPIKQDLKEDLRKWEAVCERNRENGKSGGRPRKAENNPENPVGYLGTQKTQTNPLEPKKPRRTRYDCDSDSDMSIDNDFKKEEYISASISPSEKPKPFNFLKELIAIGVSEQVAKDWIAVRKAKKATGTVTAFNRIHKQILKSGLTADECISIAVERSWQGFDAEWIHGQVKQLLPPKMNTTYERWDYKTQTRYCGSQIIPYDAPPKPSNIERWDDKLNKWIFTMN